jgi:hypothetical protein
MSDDGGGFLVQRKMCPTCIYRKDSRLDIKHLEAQVADGYGGFKGYRECHHAKRGSKVCCAGFWKRHKDRFAIGQIAQRLGLVRYVTVDAFGRKGGSP